MQIDKHGDSIYILDSIVFNLDQEYTLDDKFIYDIAHVINDEYETFDVYHDLPNIISK